MGPLFQALPASLAVPLAVLAVWAVCLPFFGRHLILPAIWLLGLLIAKTALLLSTSPQSEVWGNVLTGMATGGLLAGLLALFGMWWRWVHRHQLPTLARGQLPVGTVLLPSVVLVYGGYPTQYPYVPAMEWVEPGMILLASLMLLLFCLVIAAAKRQARQPHQASSHQASHNNTE